MTSDIDVLHQAHQKDHAERDDAPWGNLKHVHKTSAHTAKDQIKVPPEVDTMREEICPVCGSDDSYVGDKCSVCGFEKPPSIFMDPDTSLAQNVDLHQDDQEDQADDGAGELQCPNCGETFPSAEALNAEGTPHLAPAAETVPAEEDLEAPDEAAEAEGELPPGQEVAEGAEEVPEPDEDEEENQMSPPPPEGAEVPPEDEEEEEPPVPGQEEDQAQVGDEEEPGSQVPGQKEPEPSEEAVPEEAGPQSPEQAAEEQYAADQEAMQQTGYEEGDICPNCGQGLLQPIGTGDAVPSPGNSPEVSEDMPQGAPPISPERADTEPDAEAGEEEAEEEEAEEEGEEPSEDEEEDGDQEAEGEEPEDSDDEEEEDGDQPPWLKKKTVHLNYPSWEGAISTMPNRPRTNGRTTPRQAAQAPEPTPRSSVRTALHTALNAQANLLRQMTAACHQERCLRLAAEARIDTLERQMLRFAQIAGADTDPELRHINEEGYQRHASLMARAASLHTAAHPYVDTEVTPGRCAACAQEREAPVHHGGRETGTQAPGDFLAMRRRADARDPAQPVPEPGAQPPVVTEQQAAQPAARDDVTQLGASPVTDVSADATVAVDQPYGTEAFEPLNLNEVDVTAPVANTQGHLPPEQTIIPVEVRVGDPDDPQPSFGWTLDGAGAPQGQTGGSVGSGAPVAGGGGAGRQPGTTATRRPSADGQVSLGALRLARLRIQAGIAPPNQDDLTIAAAIQDNPDMTVEAVNTEIKTLTQVLSVQAPNPRVASANRRLVPRSANPEPSQVSLAGDPGEGPIRAHASTGRVTDDEILFE